MVSRVEDRTRSQLNEIEHRTELLFASLNNSSGDAEKYSSEGRSSIAKSRRRTARRVQQLLDQHLNSKDTKDTDLQAKPQRQERTATYEQHASNKATEKPHLQIEDLYERYKNLCEREGVILEEKQEQSAENFEQKVDLKSDRNFSKNGKFQLQDAHSNSGSEKYLSKDVNKVSFQKTPEHVEVVVEKPLESETITSNSQNAKNDSPRRSPKRRSPRNKTTSNDLLETNSLSYADQKRTQSVGIQVDTTTKTSKTSETQTNAALLDDQGTQTEYYEIKVKEYSQQCHLDEEFQRLERSGGEEYDDGICYNAQVLDQSPSWVDQNDEILEEQSEYDLLEESFLENDYYSTNDLGSIQDLVNEFEMEKRRKQIGTEKVLGQNKVLRKEKTKKALSGINHKGNDSFNFTHDGVSPTDQRVRTVAERRRKLEQQKLEAALKKEADLQDIHDRLRRRPKIPIKYYARSISTPPTPRSASGSSRKGLGPCGTSPQGQSMKKESQCPNFRTQPANFEKRPDWVDITHKDWSFK